MRKAPFKIKLPKRLIKALGLKPGDRLQVMVDREGNGVVVVGQQQISIPTYSEEEWGELWEAMEEVKGLWAERADIPDSRTYVRQLREGWNERLKRPSKGGLADG